MKRLLLIAFALVVVSGCGLPIVYAQSFPATRTVFWTPNPASEAVASYKVWLDGGAKATVLSSTCSATECTASVAIPAVGSHVASVSAVNVWGESTPGTFAFDAAVSKPSGIGIR